MSNSLKYNDVITCSCSGCRKSNQRRYEINKARRKVRKKVRHALKNIKEWRIDSEDFENPVESTGYIC